MKKSIKITLTFLIVSLFFSNSVFAANLFIHTETKEIKVGDIFEMIVFLDTEGQLINTAEGDLQYNDMFLNIEAVNIGGSFISFWVEKPDMKNSGKIHFSGIVPGGVSVKQGELFRVFFRAKTEGNTEILMKNLNLFLNDGQGTIVDTKPTDINIKITKGVLGDVSILEIKDAVAPERFLVMRTKDQNIYDNKNFLVFNAVDKASGVDHYEVCEYWSCVVAESPYLLKYQNIFYYIVVHAYDGNGNVVDSVLISPYILVLSFIISFILLISYFYYRYLYFNKV